MTPTVDYPANNFKNTHHRNLKTTKTIISDRDAKFASNFWKGLFARFGTKLANTSYHPQIDG